MAQLNEIQLFLLVSFVLLMTLPAQVATSFNVSFSDAYREKCFEKFEIKYNLVNGIKTFLDSRLENIEIDPDTDFVIVCVSTLGIFEKIMQPEGALKPKRLEIAKTLKAGPSKAEIVFLGVDTWFKEDQRFLIAEFLAHSIWQNGSLINFEEIYTIGKGNRLDVEFESGEIKLKKLRGHDQHVNLFPVGVVNSIDGLLDEASEMMQADPGFNVSFSDAYRNRCFFRYEFEYNIVNGIKTFRSSPLVNIDIDEDTKYVIACVSVLTVNDKIIQKKGPLTPKRLEIAKTLKAGPSKAEIVFLGVDTWFNNSEYHLIAEFLAHSILRNRHRIIFTDIFTIGLTNDEFDVEYKSGEIELNKLRTFPRAEGIFPIGVVNAIDGLLYEAYEITINRNKKRHRKL